MIQFIQPLPQQMWDYTVELNGVRIRVSLNTDDVLKNILPTEVYHIATDDDRTDFSLYAILTSSVSEECVFHSETTSFGKPPLRTEENCPNRQYIIDDSKISLYSYPNNSVHIENQARNTISILTGNKNVLIFYLKDYLKRIVADHIDRCKLHASAVALNNGAVLFLGAGNVGKSTLAYNFTTCGWSLMHDDLVFIRKKENEILAEGIRIFPSLRKNALPYLTDQGTSVLQTHAFENEYHKCYYLHKVDTVNNELPIKAVFLLSPKEYPMETPMRITAKLNRILSDFVSDANCIRLLRKLPIYTVNRNIPIKQMIRFAEMTVR